MSRDKHGHDYRDLLSIQRQHIDLWHDKLKFDLICKVEAYVQKHNQQANDDTQAHRVYRGQDLVQIIMDWPDLKPCYPPVFEQQPTAADLV